MAQPFFTVPSDIGKRVGLKTNQVSTVKMCDNGCLRWFDTKKSHAEQILGIDSVQEPSPWEIHEDAYVLSHQGLCYRVFQNCQN